MPLTIVLLVLFITLKLCDVITWSWLWVLCPLWIGIAVCIVIIIIAIVFAIIDDK